MHIVRHLFETEDGDFPNHSVDTDGDLHMQVLTGEGLYEKVYIQLEDIAHLAYAYGLTLTKGDSDES